MEKKDRGKEWIAILDFGSQYTQLIARRIREFNVYSEIYPYDVDFSAWKDNLPKGIILSGGPDSVLNQNAPIMSKDIFLLDIPILGICYGCQLIAKLMNGEIEHSTKAEFGHTLVEIRKIDTLFQGLPDEISTWMSHNDVIIKLPEGFQLSAVSQGEKIAAIVNDRKMIYGLQFHPEVTHTEYGKIILYNFVNHICQCSGNWTPQAFIDEQIQVIQQKVGEGKVVAGVSGGIDSLVAAMMTHKAIGNHLYCIFIDTGLMRKNEAEEVKSIYREYFDIPLHDYDYSQEFIQALKGITDPEEKRKTIGNLFIRIFEEKAKGIGKVTHLLQGTLYPDVIESVSTKGPSAKIKSHHNVGGLPEKMNFKLLEPLKYLFKDEVRVIAQKLNIPEKIIWRQPFPGPGLAIRVIGEVNFEKLKILREADEIIREEVIHEGFNRTLWQYFGILLPIKSVGVMGDSRTYDYSLVLRIVTSDDGMTADWAKLPHDFLAKISNRLINQVKGINRILYDISSKPPATIEWE
ncbi:MAG: glutamine-hydrolyzing GMP synthase [Candidatus Atribacteria bacterium]|nr:glutamine-hydrolyzing GMP synthase [Candidatus Atribacteria bacterium]